MSLIAGACGISPAAMSARAPGSTRRATTTIGPPGRVIGGPPITGPPTTIQPPAHTGDTVSLTANGGSNAEQVTLVKVADPAQGADRFSTPLPGDRLVGVLLRISTGASRQTVEDPAGDTLVEDTQGTMYAPRPPSNLSGCPSFPPTFTTDSSRSLTGCVAFELAYNMGVADVLFTPGGQFGTVTAEWQVH
jgi:hypothetical protein